MTLNVWKSLCHLRKESDAIKADIPAFLGARPGAILQLASSCRRLPSSRAFSIFSSPDGVGWANECQRLATFLVRSHVV